MNRTSDGCKTGILVLVGLATLAFSAGTASAGINRWTSSGPDGAGVSRVAIDPLDPAVVYATTFRKGVFRSGDGGLSWSDPSSGELDGVNLHSLAIDPLTPSNIYVGTASGVLKSTDGGASWSDRRLAGAIYNLVFGSQSSTIYAADFDDVGYYPGPSAVYRSSDDGETWSRSATVFPIGNLVVDPTRPSTLYAATCDFGGVYKSVDSGSTWSVASRDLASYCVSALALDPRNPNTLYAVTYFGLHKSEDAGSTWRVISGDLNGVYVTALAIDPRRPTTLYAGTYRFGVLQSTDGGIGWYDFNKGLANLDIATLAIDRTGTRLHAGSRTGGVFDYQIPSGALDLSVGIDSKTRLLFADPDGRLVIRGIDGSGNSFSSGPFGPYGGWDSRAVADGSDGLTRVLWNSSDGATALWLLGPEGNHSYRYGPFAGWTAVDVAASNSGSSHLLWTYADGRIALWTIDNAGLVSVDPVYGPYPGWTAVAAADGRDGLTRVLWTRGDGSAGLSLFGPQGFVASHRLGPVSGWKAVDIAVGADGQSRVLWTHLDGRMALWRVDGAGNPTARGPIYPAPPGFTASRVAAGTDGLTRVLWTGPDGAILWIMSADNVYQKSFSLGPTPLSGPDIWDQTVEVTGVTGPTICLGPDGGRTWQMGLSGYGRSRVSRRAESRLRRSSRASLPSERRTMDFSTATMLDTRTVLGRRSPAVFHFANGRSPGPGLSK